MKTRPHFENTHQLAILAAALFALSPLTGCKPEKKYTWADRLPQSDCQPRTADAKAKLGTCPKLADSQHPTTDEVNEFVAYMNKKQQIEGTLETDGLEGPDCINWKVDPSGQPRSYRTDKKQGCISYGQPLQNFKP